MPLHFELHTQLSLALEAINPHALHALLFVTQMKVARLLANNEELDARGERLQRAYVKWRESWQNEVWRRIRDANA